MGEDAAAEVGRELALDMSLTTGQGVGLGLIFAGFIAGSIGAVVVLTTDDAPGQPVPPPPPLALGSAHAIGGSWSWQF